jgi:hypothetical protein
MLLGENGEAVETAAHIGAEVGKGRGAGGGGKGFWRVVRKRFLLQWGRPEKGDLYSQGQV